MGKATPDGWAVNKDGVPSTDAAEVLGNISRHEGGGILPLGGATEVLGGHKGYGNGMIADYSPPSCLKAVLPTNVWLAVNPTSATASWLSTLNSSAIR